MALGENDSEALQMVEQEEYDVREEGEEGGEREREIELIVATVQESNTRPHETGQLKQFFTSELDMHLNEFPATYTRKHLSVSCAASRETMKVASNIIPSSCASCFRDELRTQAFVSMCHGQRKCNC